MFYLMLIGCLVGPVIITLITIALIEYLNVMFDWGITVYEIGCRV